MTTLKEAREQRNWTWYKLAKETGVSSNTVRDIERGKHRATPHIAKLIAKALDKAPEEVEELKVTVEAAGKAGDPCGCSLGCLGFKVPAKNPRARRQFDIRLPCLYRKCEVVRTIGPSYGHKHAPYCHDCASKFKVIGHLKRIDNPFAQALAKALERQLDPPSVVYARVGITAETVMRWIRGTFVPFYESVKALADELDAPDLFDALKASDIQVKAVKFAVTCPVCGDSRPYPARTINMVQAKKPDYLKSLTSVDLSTLTAVAMCRTCSNKRNGHKVLKFLKDKRFKTIDGSEFRGRNGLVERARLTMSRFTDEQREAWRSKAWESNRGRHRSDEVKSFIALRRLSG